MDLSRRELLTLFLGAPAAFVACQISAPSKFPDGEIIGQSASLGHVLREGRSFEVSPDNWESRSAVIVGAGVAGLTAAWQFRKQGLDDFLILELEKEAGGTARRGTGDPVGYPWGAHYLPVPFKENTELVVLLDEMSLFDGRDANGELLVKEQYLCREPEERLFFKGRWYEGLYPSVGATDEDKRQYSEFQKQIDHWVNWRDSKGRRAFILPVEQCSDDAEATALDKITFGNWLAQNGFTSERLIWYCDYACRDDYGSKVDQTSAWAGLFYFCSRVRKSGEESQPFITVPEGNGQFVDHFVQGLGDRLRKGTAVVSITPSEKGVDVVCFNGGTLRGIHAEHVIYASPMFTAPWVISGFREDPPFAASEFQHNAWFVANLRLKDRPKPRFQKDFPLAWDNVIYDSPGLGYVTATHQKGIDYGPTILTYYYPMCAEPNGRTTLFNYDWKQLADVCLTDLSRAHSEIYDLVERLDVMRWGHAMISPRPNFIWSGIREKAAKPYRNIHFAHTDLGGVALFEEAFYHGLRAAKEVVTAKTQKR
ncbi:MAG: FAD-dependent oxidoreductase [Acidobacteria bacterium]|nr:FAD-dependent oxidoreductase [Acidobacteriota bacterium]